MPHLFLLAHAARQLARDGILCDPSDDVILVAAAEVANDPVDLAKLGPTQRQFIISAYDEEWYKHYM